MSSLSLSHYDVALPRRIVFGWGRRGELPDMLARTWRRAFLVLGSRTIAETAAFREWIETIERSGVEVQPIATCVREPEVEDVDQTAEAIRSSHPASGDCVLAIGGGAAIDLAKAVAAISMQAGGASVRCFLEGVGDGRGLEQDPLPVVAVPTTAGTGTEATKNAVISGDDPPFKKSLRAESLIPALVVVDPELTVTLPRAQTAYSGMDAMTQLIESYISARAKPIPRALCLQGLGSITSMLERACNNPSDREAREMLAHAALLSGLALANSGLGYAHGVAAALGVHAKVPHGMACAALLPTALRINRGVSRDRFAEIADLWWPNHVGEAPESKVDRVIGEVDRLVDVLTIPRKLSDFGVERRQLPELAAASRGSSMSGNPRQLDDAELLRSLEECW